ncbi:MAG: hypothetical protein DVS81_12485 [Candidatus Accumulibacter meliphilus]|jgi:hypothetical protein|uniref:Uncharacterized protein n=1 Tax=Candidatus Accumulibacter meliphilus TaxID=2211374 RepID=A0A369XMS9_9PROT|nr:MAG: hypothetical protein DVS81_12485 [Candidatus Accumulibacter meliphilus]
MVTQNDTPGDWRRAADPILQRNDLGRVPVIAVETACGASLALAYAGSRALAGFSRVLFNVCGGATATIDQIREWSTTAAAGREDL